MRILQITSSLDAGGAERMAVNYANALSRRVEYSGLVVTRSEGLLRNDVAPGVHYLFLGKKRTLDYKATRKLSAYCKAHRIDVLHAHADSYFTALLIKLFHPKIGLVWHDHYGLSDFLGRRNSSFLAVASLFFKGIIVVNLQLKEWAERKLRCRKIIYLPNFTNKVEREARETELHGNPGARVLCLANLRPQKDHFFLVEIAKKIAGTHPDWSFHLVGQDFGDDYSRDVRKRIADEKLERKVYVYGSRRDIQNIINQSDIAVLTSQSEGLPIALLEYGLNRKPVITTAVGEIPRILNNDENGFMVEKGDLEGFARCLELLMEDGSLRERLGNGLLKTVSDHYSEESILRLYLDWIAEAKS